MRKKINISILALFFVSTTIISVEAFQGRYPVVAFLNVGQGDAIFIESPTGTQVLIDAGPDQRVISELSKIMPFWDRSIDLIIATHGDADHIAGFNHVLQRYRVSQILKTNVQAQTDVYRLFIRNIEEENIPTFIPHKDMIIDIGGGMFLKILFPEIDMNSGDTNRASIVLQVIYGNEKIMLTGDAPTSIEQYLISSRPSSLESTILKAGHHGSNTSTSKEFLSAIKPHIVIISAGENNRYGHPHKDVLERIREQGANILETKNGTIIFKGGKEGAFTY